MLSVGLACVLEWHRAGQGRRSALRFSSLPPESSQTQGRPHANRGGRKCRAAVCLAGFGSGASWVAQLQAAVISSSLWAQLFGSSARSPLSRQSISPGRPASQPWPPSLAPDTPYEAASTTGPDPRSQPWGHTPAPVRTKRRPHRKHGHILDQRRPSAPRPRHAFPSPRLAMPPWAAGIVIRAAIKCRQKRNRPRHVRCAPLQRSTSRRQRGQAPSVQKGVSQVRPALILRKAPVATRQEPWKAAPCWMGPCLTAHCTRRPHLIPPSCVRD